MLQPYSDKLARVSTVCRRITRDLQERNGVRRELLNLLIPARECKRRRGAPRVVIEGEKVAPNIIAAAVHVLRHLEPVVLNIRGRVANGDGTVASGVDVRLHVTGDGLDVRGSKRRGIVVDDLVSREEQQRVVVLGEGVDGGEDELEIDVVVREGDASVVGPVERVCRSVDVEGEIYAGVGERLHAVIVVGGVVDGVDAHGVDAQLLEVLDVACAASRVGYGVGQERAAA